jgi:hypothetical protein
MPQPIDAFSYNAALDDLTDWLATHSETGADSVPMQALGGAIQGLRKPEPHHDMNDPE